MRFHSLSAHGDIARNFVFGEYFLRGFWVGIRFIEACVLRVTHVSVRRGFGARFDNNCFGVIWFVFFYVWCLDREISAFFTFSFVIFAGCINLANQLFLDLQVLTSLVLIIIFVFSNSNAKHFVLNVWVKLKTTSTFKWNLFGTVRFFLETLLSGLD